MKRNNIFVEDGGAFVNGKHFDEIPMGTFVSIIGTDLDHKEDIGKVLLRTDSIRFPFVSLDDGFLWGTKIDSYTFKMLPHTKLTLS
jgi:hypothetical protein